MSPTSPRMDTHARDAGSRAILSSKPVLPPLSFDDHAEGAHDARVKQRSWWKPASRHDDHLSGRSASIRTTSTTSSASSVFSKTSVGSRSTAASSTISECTSPISPISESYNYHGSDNRTESPIGGFASLSLGPEVTPTSPRTECVPQLGQRPITAADRPLSPNLARSESRLESRAGHRAGQKPGSDPTAEVEMMPRKYAGYWRASFTANLPISAAMCGCLLMVAGPGECSQSTSSKFPS